MIGNYTQNDPLTPSFLVRSFCAAYSRIMIGSPNHIKLITVKTCSYEPLHARYIYRYCVQGCEGPFLLKFLGSSQKPCRQRTLPARTFPPNWREDGGSCLPGPRQHEV